MSKLDGIGLRDALAEDYQRNVRRQGGDIPFAVAQDVAAADAAVTDAVAREAKQQAPAKPAERKKGPTSLEKTLAPGDKFVKREVPPEKAVPNQLKGVIRERHEKLMRRLGQILECDKVPGARFLSLPDRPYKYPDLAIAYLSAHADYTLSRRGYRGLSDYDRDRVFKRAIEDICDRSTGRLGPWWVK